MKRLCLKQSASSRATGNYKLISEKEKKGCGGGGESPKVGMEPRVPKTQVSHGDSISNTMNVSTNASLFCTCGLFPRQLLPSTPNKWLGTRESSVKVRGTQTENRIIY